MKSKVLSTFPFSPIQLVQEQTSIVCRSYTTARKYGINMEDFGSESAAVVSWAGRTIIFYDDTKPATHISYSILHELGHPELGHDFRLKDDTAYGRYEVETNFFAAQLLMPEQLLRELQRRGVIITKRFLQKTFGVSETAAEKRLSTLAKTNAEWRSREEKEFDDIILMRHASFLDQICPRNAEFFFEDELAKQRERDSWY